MKLSFNQVIFCTAIFVSAAVKAQDVWVWNKTDKPFEITIESTDKTQNHTEILNKQKNYCCVAIPEKSICRFKATAIETGTEAVMENMHGTDYRTQIFEISLQNNIVDIRHGVSPSTDVTLEFADQ